MVPNVLPHDSAQSPREILWNERLLPFAHPVTVFNMIGRSAGQVATLILKKVVHLFEPRSQDRGRNTILPEDSPDLILPRLAFARS